MLLRSLAPISFLAGFDPEMLGRCAHGLEKRAWTALPSLSLSWQLVLRLVVSFLLTVSRKAHSEERPGYGEHLRRLWCDRARGVLASDKATRKLLWLAGIAWQIQFRCGRPEQASASRNYGNQI